MLNSLLIAMGLLSPPYLGQCYHFERLYEVECTYKSTYKEDKQFISSVGKYFLAGPWLLNEEELIHPAILLLAGERTIILNADIEGSADIRSNIGSLLANDFFHGPSRIRGQD